MRALEVTLGAGRPFSSFGPGLQAYPPTDVVMIGLRWPRQALAERIDERVHRMVADGLPDEVDALAAAGPLSRRPARRSATRSSSPRAADLDAAVAAIIRRTRQFAVRQERWFRRDPRVRWIDIDHDPVAEAAPTVIDALRAIHDQSQLTKHHGLGNDFLVMFDPPSDDLPALARRLCDRRRGIGADGLLVGSSEPDQRRPRWCCSTPTAVAPR